MDGEGRETKRTAEKRKIILRGKQASIWREAKKREKCIVRCTYELSPAVPAVEREREGPARDAWWGLYNLRMLFMRTCRSNRYERLASTVLAGEELPPFV